MSDAVQSPGRKVAQSEAMGIAGSIFSALVVGIILTGIAPLLILNMEKAGLGTSWIALMGATPALAVICMSASIPHIIKGLGAARSMAAAIALATIMLMLFPLFPPGPYWFVLRFVMALGVGTMLVVSETWTISLSRPERRGTVLSLYTTAITAGFAVGPLLVSWTGSNGTLPFFAIAAIMLAAILSIPLASRNGAPDLRDHKTMPLREAFRRTPSIMFTLLFVGMIWLILMALLPLYAVRTGMTEREALILLTCFVGGNIVFQYPIGRLLDRQNEELFLIFCSVAQILGSIGTLWATAIPAEHLIVLPVILVLWGGFLGGAYTAALTLLGRVFTTDELSGANSAGSLAIELGGLVGPLLAGAAMQMTGPYGMIVITAGAGACLLWITARLWQDMA